MTWLLIAVVAAATLLCLLLLSNELLLWWRDTEDQAHLDEQAAAEHAYPLGNVTVLVPNSFYVPLRGEPLRPPAPLDRSDEIHSRDSHEPADQLPADSPG